MNNTFSWLYLFNYHIAEIESNSTNLLGSPIDNIEDELVNEKDEQEDSDNNEYEKEIWSEWILLAEISSNIVIDKYSDLGSCEIDRNYN